MPDQTKPLVSALIVSHNAKDRLLQCLQAFYASADMPVEAVIVDNDSSDGSAAAVTDEFPQATVLVQPKNLGYGRAANVGLERCQGRFVLLLDTDVTVDALCVGRLADFLLTRPDAGAVGPRVLLPSGRLDPDARRAFPIPSTLFYRTVGLSRLFPRSPRFGRHNMGHVPESDVHEIDAGTGACLMLRMNALDRVGFFDPRSWAAGRSSTCRRRAPCITSSRPRPLSSGDGRTSAIERCGRTTQSITRRMCPPSATGSCGLRFGPATWPGACVTP
jgi:hypothetical protein